MCITNLFWVHDRFHGCFWNLSIFQNKIEVVIVYFFIPFKGDPFDRRKVLLQNNLVFLTWKKLD